MEAHVDDNTCAAFELRSNRAISAPASAAPRRDRIVFYGRQRTNPVVEGVGFAPGSDVAFRRV